MPVSCRTKTHPRKRRSRSCGLDASAFSAKRGADVKRLLGANGWPALLLDTDDWGRRAWSVILDVWLRLLRKQGWGDLDAVQARVADLRASQRDYEPGFLHEAEQRRDAGPAWELMTTYHLAKAAEIPG